MNKTNVFNIYGCDFLMLSNENNEDNGVFVRRMLRIWYDGQRRWQSLRFWELQMVQENSLKPYREDKRNLCDLTQKIKLINEPYVGNTMQQRQMKREKDVCRCFKKKSSWEMLV